jgi:excisionase family DNA binding protein
MPMMKQLPGYLSLSEFATAMRVGYRTAQTYVRSGAVKSIRVGTAYLIARKDAARFKPPTRGRPAKKERK